jgi:hypothetical protein
MYKRIRRPSPALVVSLIALFVALTGSAVASTIVARAKLADNSLKIQGKTADALVEQAGELPGPASSAAGLVTVKGAAYSLAPRQQSEFTAACDPGAKAISGGLDDTAGSAVPFDTRPSVDGQSWRMYLANVSTSNPSTGTLYAICIA